MFSSYMLWLGCLAAVVSAESNRQLPPTLDNGTIFELPLDDLSLTGALDFGFGPYIPELVVMDMGTSKQCHGILFVTSPDRVFNTDIVVTTALCMSKLGVKVGDTITDVRVQIQSNTTYLSRTATVVAIHPCFQRKGYIADMAVIKLNAPYADTAAGVFNSNDNIPELNGDLLLTYGYGKNSTAAGTPYPATLRGLTMNYLRGCRESFLDLGLSYYSETHLCAVHAFKSGPCTGDGGIPIYALEDYTLAILDGNYKYVLVGLFTFFTRNVDLDEDFCQASTPIGFTRIRWFYDWVVEIQCTKTGVSIPSYCATRTPPNTDCSSLPTEPGNVDSASCRSATSLETSRNLKPWEMAYQNLKSWANRMGMAISTLWNS